MRIDLRQLHGQHKQAGLTVLELMIASSIFAVVLLVLAVGAVSFTNSFYRGITSSKTQGDTRLVMSQLSQAIQFSQHVNVVNGNPGCISSDTQMFVFALDKQIDPNPDVSKHQGFHALLTGPGSCSAGIPVGYATALGAPGNAGTATQPAGSHELLGQHMRLAAFQVSALAGNLYAINVRVAYGDDDLLTSPVSATMQCLGGIAGFQFCSVSDLQTTVERRLL